MELKRTEEEINHHSIKLLSIQNRKIEWHYPQSSFSEINSLPSSIDDYYLSVVVSSSSGGNATFSGDDNDANNLWEVLQQRREEATTGITKEGDTEEKDGNAIDDDKTDVKTGSVSLVNQDDGGDGAEESSLSTSNTSAVSPTRFVQFWILFERAYQASRARLLSFETGLQRKIQSPINHDTVQKPHHA